MLEKHILEARAKAMAYEDREELKRQRICEDPDRFGVPPTKSYFSYCLDDTLLRENGLLAPSDYYCRVKTPSIAMPKIAKSDLHLKETVASSARSWVRSASTKFLKSAAFDEAEEYHKEGSCILSDDNSISSDDEDVIFCPLFMSQEKCSSEFQNSSVHGPNLIHRLIWSFLKMILNESQTIWFNLIIGYERHLFVDQIDFIKNSL